MNKLPLEKRIKIIQLLAEGNSMRSTARIIDVSINTVMKLFINVGRVCLQLHDDRIKKVGSVRVQCDEIWSFVKAQKQTIKGKVQRRAGDVWVWVAFDPDSRLVITWKVGKRNAATANKFMLTVASKLKNRVQLTTDGFAAYIDAVGNAFGTKVDYAQIVKKVLTSKIGEQEKLVIEKHIICGNPDPRYISTSLIERQNLTIRMQARRFTRKTNGFSKKIENHNYSLALHFVYYNFIRIHETLRVTPAMEAGLTRKFLEIEDLIKMADALPA